MNLKEEFLLTLSSINLDEKCHHFFFMLPSLIAYFHTECFSILLTSKGQLEFSSFLNDGNTICLVL